jgi:hypothetical protein
MQIGIILKSDIPISALCQRNGKDMSRYTGCANLPYSLSGQYTNADRKQTGYGRLDRDFSSQDPFNCKGDAIKVFCEIKL